MKRRSRRRNKAWIPVLLGVLLVGGIAGWFFWTSQEKLEGTLSAIEWIEPKLEPRVLDSSYIQLESEKIQAALKYLEENPIRGLDSGQLMEHDVETLPDGLSIHVYAPPGMRFFQVPYSDNSALSR
ncbi:MAG: hypothetical protein Tsb009_10690 [Planctomycetaceae bacterium]